MMRECFRFRVKKRFSIFAKYKSITEKGGNGYEENWQESKAGEEISAGICILCMH